MRSSRWLTSGLLLTGASLAACGGGPQGGPGPIAIVTATPSPVSSSSTATSSPAPGTTGVATATPTPAVSAAATATATPGLVATPTPTPLAVATPTPTPVPTPAATAGNTTLPAGEKIYVVNHGQLGDNPSVTIYPSTASGAATPLATIAGSNANLHQAFFDVVDAAGTLYVSNQSETPGNSTSGYVSEYAATDQSGNVPPTNAITGLHNPEGLAIDAAGNLYVSVTDEIEVFAPGAKGNATPIRTIAGAMTALQNTLLGGQPAGLALDAAGDEYVTMGPSVLEFAPGATGNVAPTAIFGGVNGSNPAQGGPLGMGLPPYGFPTLASCLGIAVDSSNTLYCANFNNSTFAMFTSDAAGVTSATSTLTMPFGLNVDAGGSIYATSYATSAVGIFSPAATIATGAALTTISGAGTGLNYPYGVTTH